MYLQETGLRWRGQYHQNKIASQNQQNEHGHLSRQNSYRYEIRCWSLCCL